MGRVFASSVLTGVGGAYEAQVAIPAGYTVRSVRSTHVLIDATVSWESGELARHCGISPTLDVPVSAVGPGTLTVTGTGPLATIISSNVYTERSS